MSDKLDETLKVSFRLRSCGPTRVAQLTTKLAKRHEREASSLRDKIADLEPRLNRSQQVSNTVQKQSEQQQVQSNELLLQVFMDLNKFLGVEVCPRLSDKNPLRLGLAV